MRLFGRVFAIARFRAADHELAPEEFFIVQFLHCALRFIDRLHRDEGKTFRALIVAIAHDLGVLHVADTVEELEQIALGRIEGQIADVKTRRSNLDRFRLVLRPRLALFALLVRPMLLMLLLAVTRLRGWFFLAAAVATEKCDDALPKCFLLRSVLTFALILKASASAPTSRPAASMTLASPRLIRVHVCPQ